MNANQLARRLGISRRTLLDRAAKRGIGQDIGQGVHRRRLAFTDADAAALAVRGRPGRPRFDPPNHTLNSTPEE